MTSSYIDINSILLPPSLQHWFGTDPLGRDLFQRVLEGSKMSLSVAFLTALVSLLIGLSLGSLAAYRGGLLDEIIVKFIDFFYSLPDLLVLSLVALFLSRSTTGIIFGLAFINWMDLARLTRAEILKIKHEEFIEYSRLIGVEDLDLVLKHMLPNILGLIIVTISFTIPRAILSESTLSFIGLGISPPETSWGTLAGDAWQYLRSDPHLIFFPALMIFVVVLLFNFLGDKLRDRLDPKSNLSPLRVSYVNIK